MMRALRLISAVLLACALLLPAAAVADPPRPPAATAPIADEVSIRVLVVRGTNSNDYVDPELERLVARLRQMNYRGFSLIDRQRAELRDGRSTTFAIEGGRQLEVELLDHDAQKATLHLVLISPKGKRTLDTTVSVHRNKSFIVAGPRLGEDVLFLPVTARY